MPGQVTAATLFAASEIGETLASSWPMREMGRLTWQPNTRTQQI